MIADSLILTENLIMYEIIHVGPIKPYNAFIRPSEVTFTPEVFLVLYP